MALERELGTYRKELPNLLGEEGKFVLIMGEEVAGTWATFEDAVQEGYRLFGLEPFLVKQVRGVELRQTITRLLAPPRRP